MIPLTFQKEVNEQLKGFFDKKRVKSKALDLRLPLLVDQIADITLRGGDRLRPYMCYLGYQTTHNSQLSPIMPVLLSLELFHTFALIHDDIMDKGEMRRGGHTIHAYFTQNLRNTHLARSLALLAGDLCFEWSQELFDMHEGKSKFELRHVFNQMREEVILGQTAEVWGMQGRSVKDIFKLYPLKSGNYSVQKPLILGAILGNASESLLQQLSRYGELVGLIFHLKDDLLGVFGDENTGKSTSSDIVEGKWTPLLAMTYEKLSQVDKSRLNSIVGNSDASSNDIQWIRNKMQQTGAVIWVETKMSNLLEEALSIVDSLSTSTKQELTDIAQFMIERKK